MDLNMGQNKEEALYQELWQKMPQLLASQALYELEVLPYFLCLKEFNVHDVHIHGKFFVLSSMYNWSLMNTSK